MAVTMNIVTISPLFCSHDSGRFLVMARLLVLKVILRSHETQWHHAKSCGPAAAPAILALASHLAVLTNAAAPAILVLAPHPAVLTNAAAPALSPAIHFEATEGLVAQATSQ
jgi:hypothetical protein